MADKIKAFFASKLGDRKFKSAGRGQKLGDSADAEQAAAAREAKAQAELQRRQQQQQQRAGASGGARATAAQQNAAQAAMARFNTTGAGPSNDEEFEKKRSQAVIRAQVQKQLEQEKKAAAEAERLKSTYGEKPSVSVDGASALTCQGVFFHCPLIGPDVLPKKEMIDKIRSFLYEQVEEEKGLTACLIIRTMAKSDEKAKNCVDTLCKYLDNILKNPEEEKYRKIRQSNRVFQEKVAAVEGHDLFLQAAGFEATEIDEETYWFLPSVSDDLVTTLITLREALVDAEPIRAELDRGMRVLYPNQVPKKFTPPPDFFSHSPEEIKKEQQARAEALEREGMLRTKAMREREQEQIKKLYRYTLIRIRFPDGLVLQGTFSVYEPFRLVRQFVMECLNIPHPFLLYEAGAGGRFEADDEDTRLVDLKLAPAAVLSFGWDPPEAAKEIEANVGKKMQYLNDDVMALATSAE